MLGQAESMGIAGAGRASASEGGRRRVNQTSPSLSVVLVADGDCTELNRTIRLLDTQIAEYGAQLVIVRRNADPGIESALSQVARYRLVRAPDDCPRSEMRALGMAAAQGDIVVLRDNSSPVSSDWLSCFHQTMTKASADRADGAAERKNDFVAQLGIVGAPRAKDGARDLRDAHLGNESSGFPVGEKAPGEFPPGVAASA
jgi:hypothetical protein